MRFTFVPRINAIWFLPLLLCFCLPARAQNSGFQLNLGNADNWGYASYDLIQQIQNTLQNSRFLEATDTAKLIAASIATGKVPAIDDLAHTIEGDVQDRVEDAVAQATQVTQLLGTLDVNSLKQLFETLQATAGEEVAFSIPNGRVVFRPGLGDPNGPSLCAVVAHAGGVRVTLGMSGGPQLCKNPSERFANPTGEPVLFIDLAKDYSHVQVRRNLLAPPGSYNSGPRIEAATYFKIHDDWVQLRFAGNDPESLTLKMQFVVGVKGGFSYKLQAEIEGQVLVEVAVKPTEVTAMLQDINLIIQNGLGTTAPAGLKLDPDLITPTLKQVFDYLKNAKDHGKEIGEFSIAVAVDGGVGVGLWDTGINLGSVGAQMTLSVPLEAVVALSANGLSAFLEASLQSSEQIVSLFEAMGTGQLTEVELSNQLALVRTNSTQLAQSLLGGFVTYIQEIDLSLEAGVYALGDIGQAAAQTIPLIVAGVDIPVGQMLVDGVNGIPTFVNGVAETAQAMAWVAQLAISSTGGRSLGEIIHPPTVPPGASNPPTPPTAAQWQAMASHLLDDVTFSLRMGVIAIEDVSLGNLVRLAGSANTVTTSVLTGAVTSAVTYTEKPLLDALRAMPGQLAGEALNLAIFNLQTISVATYGTLGASGTVGAEVTVGLGGSISFDARLKASLLLLALDHPGYDEDDGTVLAGFDIPISASASVGVSLGEAVEFTAEGGFTAEQSLAGLTLKDWGQDLPAPAGLTVAGFEVLEFTGTNNQDGTISGEGWLVLPQGGIVKADSFALDADGHVVSGEWNGALELGPFGYINLIGGQITDGGLTGSFDYFFYGVSLDVDFRLRSDGLLFGTASGAFDLGGFAMSNIDLSLQDNGQFAGTTKFQFGGVTYDGNLQILVAGHPLVQLQGTTQIGGVATNLDLYLGPGFANGTAKVNIFGQPVSFDVSVTPEGLYGTTTANIPMPWGGYLLTDLTLDNTGVHGSGMIRVLGSEFNSTNLRLQPDGRLTGSFSGTLSVAGINLVVSSLTITNDKLEGLTTIDIAGHSAVQLKLGVDPLGVTGNFVNDLELFGAGRSEAWLRIQDRVPYTIEVYGSLDLAFLNQLEVLLKDQLLGRISEARGVLSQGEQDLAKLQNDLAAFDQQLAALEVEIKQEMEAAKGAAETLVNDLQQDVNEANAELNAAINDLIAISGDLSAELARLEQAFRDATLVLNALRAEVDKTTREIAALDAWYNNLNLAGKIFHALGYGIQRGAKEAYRAGVQVSLDAAQIAYNTAWAALKAVRDELSNATILIGIRDEKDAALKAVEAEFDDAQAELAAIIDYIANPKLHPRYLAALAGRQAIVLFIAGVEGLIDITDDVLGEIAGLIDFIDQYGPAALVDVNSVRFRSTLDKLNQGFAEISVDAVIAGQRQFFTVNYNFKTGDNLGNIAAATSVLPGDLQPSLDWKRSPWTDDASTGLSPDRTLWAYYFNSTGTTTVNAVPVVGIPGGVLTGVAGKFSINGLNGSFTNDTNQLTAGGGGSSVIARNFIYNGNPGGVTFQGLTPGTTYVATFFSVGFDLNATRLNTFSGPGGGLAIDQNQYGNDQGIRIDHTFTPTATTYTVNIQPAEVATFHLYALALSAQGKRGVRLSDWKQAQFEAEAFNPALSDDLADPDGDGVPNLLEYALRANPRANGRVGLELPVPTTLPGSIAARRMSFPYQATAGDLVYRVQYSRDLRAWTDVYSLNLATGATTQLTGVNGSTDQNTQIVTIDITDLSYFTGNYFWRLTVDKL